MANAAEKTEQKKKPRSKAERMKWIPLSEYKPTPIPKDLKPRRVPPMPKKRGPQPELLVP